MDAFEENLQTFSSSIYGSEIRDALYRCASLLYVKIEYYTKKLQEIKSKIESAERGA